MASDLDRLRAMVEAAHPRPWTLYDGHVVAPGGCSYAVPMSGADGPAIVAIMNTAPELLAVAEAAERAVWEQTESGDAHRFHQALADALDALSAKLREVV